MEGEIRVGKEEGTRVDRRIKEGKRDGERVRGRRKDREGVREVGKDIGLRGWKVE